MCIPYGAISALAGVAFYFLNAANLAAAAFIGGATALAASVFSLQEWKAGGDSKVYTLTSLASAAAVAYTSVCSLPLLSGVGHAAAVVLCGLSTALSLFCAYNVLAGGNPPPKAGGKGAAKTA